MPKENTIDKTLRKAGIKERDLLLLLALRFIHQQNLETQFLEYLENVKKEAST